MALYAVDDDHLIYALEAEPGKCYWCLECFLPVKVRRGKNRYIPHFYHLRPSPQCRLYSKSEDHMRAQIELQKLFPEGELQIERPFFDIHRVADLCWEKEKIIFEVQCSLLKLGEAESRIHDYRFLGYEIVWLLDDRVYNKKNLRPNEALLRASLAYFLSLKRNLSAAVYDQFEILIEEKRLKKGKPLFVDLQKPKRHPPLQGNLPKQILNLTTGRHFFGDRTHLALKSQKSLSIALYLENWRSLEIQFAKTPRKPSRIWAWIQEHILARYHDFLNRLNG